MVDIEKLAEIEHERWSDWMNWVYQRSKLNGDGTLTIHQEDLTRWMRQAGTSYEKLSEKEKESDRREVLRYLPILEADLAAVRGELQAAKAEIERLEGLLSGDVSLLEYSGGTLTLEHPLFKLFANMMHELFIQNGAKNYLEIELQHRGDNSLDWYVLTIQNKDKKTPHQFRLEAEERVSALEAFAKMVREYLKSIDAYVVQMDREAKAVLEAPDGE